MGKRSLKIGAVFAVAVLLCSALVVVSTTTADAATPADYKVLKNSAGKTLVKDIKGRTVYSSSNSLSAIQYAVDRTPNEGMVKIKAGEYTLTGAINAKAGVTISGVGDRTVLKNGMIDIHVSNVMVKSLRMEGSCRVVIMPTNANVNNVIVQDVSATVSGVESVFCVVTNAYKVSNVKFIRDTVKDSGSAGFQLTGSAEISDVSIESCKVIGSGLTNRYNDWVTGFILAQNAPMRNIFVFNCEASNNWENGFFLKPSVSKTNVVMKDCIANNNGQKPSYQEGYGYLLDASVSMVNCTGTGNKGGLTNLVTPPTPEPQPVASKVTLTMAASSVEVGKTMTANGVLTGSSAIAGASISVKITTPDGATVNPTQGATVITDSAGKFVMSYVPTKVGTYTFTAAFAGNSQYTGSSASATCNAVAAPAPEPVATKVTLALSATSVETGKTMTANGVLTGSTGIAGATVTVKVTLPDGTVVDPVQGATVTTDSAGKFTVTYVPTKVGTYKITATYAGNSQYSGSSASASFSAVAPPTPPAPTPTGYDYIIQNNVVKTASGSTAYTGSSFTAALQWAMSQGGKTTYVPAGSYTVTARINVAGGTVSSPTTLIGDGDGTSGTVLTFTANSESNSEFYIYNTNNVAMKKLRIVSGAIEMRCVGTTVGNYLFEDMTLYRTNLYQPNGKHEASWQMSVLSSGVISGVSYYRCKVIEGGGVGFEPYGDFTGWVKNCYYEDCLCSRIGLDSSTRFNEWVVGFDIAESANVDNVIYLRCTAEYIFESGFHSEPRTVTNVLIKDCVAHHCGMKPENFQNSEGLPPGPYFGNGYFCPHNSQIFKNVYVTLQNCQGWANANGDTYGGGDSLPPVG